MEEQGFKNEFDEDEKKMTFSFLSKYLLKYKSLVVQLAVGLLAGSLLSLILPFLTQSIVDVGIQNQDLNFIYLVLIAQIMLFLGRMGIEVIRSWILLHLSTRINISIISDFFIKLMKLSQRTHILPFLLYTIFLTLRTQAFIFFLYRLRRFCSS